MSTHARATLADRARIPRATSARAHQLTVTVPVRNTGERAGQTVIQLYVHDVEARLDRPNKKLKAFAKVTLEPHEARDVTLRLKDRGVAYPAWSANSLPFHAPMPQFGSRRSR